ncbi:MAG: hypothetical protein AAGG75_22930 [Bacteroidota bacterium]
MITYEQVKSVMSDPPSVELIDLFNDISRQLSKIPGYTDNKNAYDQLQDVGNFCISATSIQSEYIAFVLGKHVQFAFPQEVLKLFFNIETHYKLQFSRIEGNMIDGCICLIHQGNQNFDLQSVYDHIYS